MECAPVRAQLWLDAIDLDLASSSVGALVALVEDAGLRAHVVPYGTDRATSEQHGDRVNLYLTAAGALAGIDAG